jgi:hypothetical protein
VRVSTICCSRCGDQPGLTMGITFVFSTQASASPQCLIVPLPHRSARLVQPWLPFAMSLTLVCMVAAAGFLCAASVPALPESLVRSQDEMDWRFWMVFAMLVVMTGRQLTQDVLALHAWMSHATPLTHEAEPGVPEPGVPSDQIDVNPTAESENTMSGPVEAAVVSSSSGPVPPPLVPIFVSRYGEKYHYRKECSGLRLAILAGIDSKTLCKICASERAR